MSVAGFRSEFIVTLPSIHKFAGVEVTDSDFRCFCTRCEVSHSIPKGWEAAWPSTVEALRATPPAVSIGTPPPVRSSTAPYVVTPTVQAAKGSSDGGWGTADTLPAKRGRTAGEGETLATTPQKVPALAAAGNGSAGSLQGVSAHHANAVPRRPVRLDAAAERLRELEETLGKAKKAYGSLIAEFAELRSSSASQWEDVHEQINTMEAELIASVRARMNALRSTAKNYCQERDASLAAIQASYHSIHGGITRLQQGLAEAGTSLRPDNAGELMTQFTAISSQVQKYRNAFMYFPKREPRIFSTRWELIVSFPTIIQSLSSFGTVTLGAGSKPVRVGASAAEELLGTELGASSFGSDPTTTRRSWKLRGMEQKEDFWSLVPFPDGTVATSRCDNVLRIWNPTTGACIQRLGHPDLVFDAAVLPNGNVVTGCKDKTLKIWDRATGTVVRTLTGHNFGVYCVCILPDGTIASGGQDTTVRIWLPETGVCVRTLTGHTGNVKDVCVLPATGQLASASNDKTIRLWSLTDFSLCRVLEGHTGPVRAVAPLSEGRLVSASNDQDLRIWSAVNGTCLRTLIGHTALVLDLAVLPSGNIISCSKDKTLRVWNPTTGDCMRTLKGHRQTTSGVGILSDGKAASISWDATICLWE